jgi:hypothetical protein
VSLRSWLGVGIASLSFAVVFAATTFETASGNIRLGYVLSCGLGVFDVLPPCEREQH